MLSEPDEAASAPAANNNESPGSNGVITKPDRLSRDKKVVIHCRSGARSGSVINAMEKQFGFDNLYNLKGGIVAYINEIGPAVERG